MKTGTSCFSPFGLQQDKLSDHLLEACRSGRVDAEIVNKVLAAVDALSPTSFQTIQDRKLESFQPADSGTSRLEFCHHILKAVRLYTTFLTRDDKTRDTSANKTAANRSILDIGSGSGAFVFVCNSLGHHARGMEHPRSNKSERLTQLNYLLSAWYAIKVIPHTIEPGAKLPVADATVDDFFVLYPTVYPTWNELDWDFFLTDLARCATKDHSKLHIRISKQKTKQSGEARFSHGEFLTSIANTGYSRIRDKCYVVDLL